MATVDIVLATHNGARFLSQQLDSIVRQSFTDWHVIVRDDHSTDQSAEILDEYRQRLVGQMTVLDDDDGRVGPTRNFERVLASSSAPYLAFCDQDDVWLPEKLERGLDELRRLRLQHGAEVPALVFSDAIVVDGSLAPMKRSFLDSSGLRPRDAGRLEQLLHRNVVSGNTMMFNASVRDRALPIPRDAPLIDWWVALVACATGHVTYLPEPSVLYRQHDANVIGAQPIRARLWNRLAAFPRNASVRGGVHRRRLEQAAALHDRIAAELNRESTRVLRLFMELSTRRRLPRAALAWRHGLLPRGVVNSLVFIWSAPTSIDDV